MDPQESRQPSPKAKIPDDLPVREPGEHEIFVLKRHPIGILGVYAMCATILVITAALAIVMSPEVFGSDNTTKAVTAGTLVFLIVAIICAAFTFITNKIYWSNTWTLTSDSLTQVNQFSLFRRESSQLSLENLEDVTAEQNGMLPRILNFGVLRVETAGESGKFIFIFCPNPNYYAEQIIKAREAFEQHLHQESGTYQQPSPASSPQTQPVSQAAPEPEIDSYEVPGGPDGSA